MAASVWIASSMEKPFGASICRCRALTIPLVTVPSSPNGLPTAITPSPTASELELPRVSGCSFASGASTVSTARSVDASVPTTSAG